MRRRVGPVSNGVPVAITLPVGKQVNKAWTY